MNIMVVKLASGEELVSDCLIDEEDNVTLSNPAQIVLSPGPNGLNISLIPFMPFVKGHKIIFNAEHVVAMGFPEDDMYNAYNERYGSGLRTPPEKKLVLPG